MPHIGKTSQYVMHVSHPNGVSGLFVRLTMTGMLKSDC